MIAAAGRVDQTTVRTRRRRRTATPWNCWRDRHQVNYRRICHCKRRGRRGGTPAPPGSATSTFEIAAARHEGLDLALMIAGSLFRRLDLRHRRIHLIINHDVDLLGFLDRRIFGDVGLQAGKHRRSVRSLLDHPPDLDRRNAGRGPPDRPVRRTMSGDGSHATCSLATCLAREASFTPMAPPNREACGIGDHASLSET